MTDEILTIREVAELLKLNEKTAYKLALAGEIPGFKVGGSWRFERQAIASWIKRKVEAAEKYNIKASTVTHHVRSRLGPQYIWKPGALWRRRKKA